MSNGLVLDVISNSILIGSSRDSERKASHEPCEHSGQDELYSLCSHGPSVGKCSATQIPSLGEVRGIEGYLEADDVCVGAATGPQLA
jgi:hypothetical protein